MTITITGGIIAAIAGIGPDEASMEEVGIHVHKGNISMQGYFTTRGRVEAQQKKSWERRYFVLLNNGSIFIYNSRQDFRLEPKEPIYTRPLKLINFFIKVDNTDANELAEVASSDHKTNKSDMLKEHEFRFQITLMPRENETFDASSQFRNNWILRCDTEEELNIWLGIMKVTCPSCFR